MARIQEFTGLPFERWVQERGRRVTLLRSRKVLALCPSGLRKTLAAMPLRSREVTDEGEGVLLDLRKALAAGPCYYGLARSETEQCLSSPQRFLVWVNVSGDRAPF